MSHRSTTFHFYKRAKFTATFDPHEQGDYNHLRSYTSKKGPTAMATFSDVRVLYGEDEDLSAEALMRNWPCIPGETVDSISGLDCAVVLLRVIMAQLHGVDRPKMVVDAGAVDRFLWAVYNGRADRYEETLQRMRFAAFAEIVEQQGNLTPSFTQICRGPMMVDALWNHPTDNFQLTHPEVTLTLGVPGGRITKDLLAIAREGTLAWDGVIPGRVEQLVNGVTSMRSEGRNTVYNHLNCAWILQVDLVQGQGHNTLLNMWRFEATVSVRGRLEASDRPWGFHQQKQCYAILAIVRCRDPPHRLTDAIRVFDIDGEEVLPDLATNNPVAYWGFRLHEPIPVGERLQIFYRKVLTTDARPPRELREIVDIDPEHMMSVAHTFMGETVFTPGTSMRDTESVGEESLGSRSGCGNSRARMPENVAAASTSLASRIDNRGSSSRGDSQRVTAAGIGGASSRPIPTGPRGITSANGQRNHGEPERGLPPAREVQSTGQVPGPVQSTGPPREPALSSEQGRNRHPPREPARDRLPPRGPARDRLPPRGPAQSRGRGRGRPPSRGPAQASGRGRDQPPHGPGQGLVRGRGRGTSNIGRGAVRGAGIGRGGTQPDSRNGQGEIDIGMAMNYAMGADWERE